MSTPLSRLPRTITMPCAEIPTEQFVAGMSKDELRAIIHEICGSSALSIEEVRKIVNAESYND